MRRVISMSRSGCLRANTCREGKVYGQIGVSAGGVLVRGE